MRLLIVRHGETVFNRDGVMQGQIQTKLTEKGLKQAELLAERLREEKIAAVYSSTLERAFETARIIAAKHGMQPVSVPELNERSYGVHEGKKISELKEKFPQEFEDGLAWEFFTRPLEGEHYWDVKDRVVPFVQKLAEKHASETVLIVSHGDVNRVLISSLLDLRGAEKYMIKQDNVCLNEIIMNNGTVELVKLNDTCHLKNQ